MRLCYEIGENLIHCISGGRGRFIFLFFRTECEAYQVQKSVQCAENYTIASRSS